MGYFLLGRPEGLPVHEIWDVGYGVPQLLLDTGYVVTPGAMKPLRLLDGFLQKTSENYQLLQFAHISYQDLNI